MAEEELPELEPLPLDPAELEDPAPVEDESIRLADEPTGDSKIQAFGARTGAVTGKKKYRRALHLNGTGATRCRIFHCKIGPGPIDYMENQINDWLDGEEIEVKFATQVVGVLEGKNAEPNLFVTIWY